MRRSAVPLGLLAAVLLTGCSGSPDPDRAAPATTATTATTPSPTAAPTPTRPVGSPLPVRVTKVEIPFPSVAQVEAWVGPPLGEGATPLEQIKRQLRYETLMQARVPAPTTERCARLSLAPSARTKCTVTYAGQRVPFTVVMDDEQADNSGAVDLFAYRVYQDRFVVRADVIRSEAWRLYGSDGTPTRCSVIPAVQVLPEGRTRHRCQHLVDGVWEPDAVQVTDTGAVIVV